MVPPGLMSGNRHSNFDLPEDSFPSRARAFGQKSLDDDEIYVHYHVYQSNEGKTCIHYLTHRAYVKLRYSIVDHNIGKASKYSLLVDFKNSEVMNTLILIS